MSRRFNVSKLSFAGESLDTTVNQQNQQQAEIVKEAAAKEAEKEITPLIEPDQSANPDPSVSGQPGPNGDSSVNGEKPTAGIDSGSEELTQALEELEQEITGTLLDVNTMIDQSDNAERLNAAVSSVQSPTETELALIKMAVDIADIAEPQEQIAAESIDEIRALINKSYSYANEGIGESIINVFKGIVSWFRAKLIMMRSSYGRIKKLEALLVKHRGKQFSFSTKPSAFHYVPEGDTSRFLSSTSEWKQEIIRTLDMVMKYMSLFGQGIGYMERDFNKAVTGLLKSDDEKASIAKTEYENYIEKMVLNIKDGLGLQKTTQSIGEANYFESEVGVGGVIIAAQHQALSASEAANPSAQAYAAGIRSSFTEIKYAAIYDRSKTNETFEVNTNDLLEIVRYLGQQINTASRIFENQILTPLYTLEGYLDDSSFRAVSSNAHVINKTITFAQNARAAAQRFSALGKMLTALAQNTKQTSWAITDLLDDMEVSITRFVTAAVVSKEITA